MKKSLSCLSLVFTVLFLVSCKGGSAFIPSSSGAPYEVLVVIDHDLWERPAGRALFDVLDKDMPGLPQSERTFKIMYTAPKDFNAILKLVRNIVMVDIQGTYTQAKFKAANDVYAAPQSVLGIQAPNEEELKTFIDENQDAIIDYFTRAEMNRQIALLEKSHSDYISTKMASKFDCDIWVLGELKSSKEGKDFFWASNNSGATDMSLVVYSYPYTDKNTFTKQFFVQKRDSVMKANIPGASAGSYMATDSLTVVTRPLNVQDEYAFEARGLWKMKGDFMGGPFVSHSRVDKVHNRVIVAEIFIYSPDKMKRNLVRMMEASLYTLKLPHNRQPQALPSEN